MIETDEQLWAGVYGVQYTTRFNVDWEPRVDLMRWVIEETGAKSVLDVGTNAGWNLRALQKLGLGLELNGVDINEWVAIAASSMGFKIAVMPARNVGRELPTSHDLVMHSGLLIHVPPELLQETMISIIDASKRWVLAIEYFAGREKVKVKHSGVPRTWARPYGGLYQDLGLKLRGRRWADGYVDCRCWLFEK